MNVNVPLVLNAKRFIANRKALQQYQCSICYQLSSSTLRCKGPCAKPYCAKCVGRIKYVRDVCPSKCSKPFQTEPIPNLLTRYECPYDPQHCLNLHSSIEQFEVHCWSCPLKTVEAEKQLKQRKNFECSQGHKLLLVTSQILNNMQMMEKGFYTTVMNDLCWSCGGRNLCRAICPICSTLEHRHVYCIQCRKFPFKRNMCEYGHQYIKTQLNGNYGCVCDLCGIAGSMVSDHGYAEYDCDIFLCALCYSTLPDSAPQPAPVAILQEGIILSNKLQAKAKEENPSSD